MPNATEFPRSRWLRCGATAAEVAQLEDTWTDDDASRMASLDDQGVRDLLATWREAAIFAPPADEDEDAPDDADKDEEDDPPEPGKPPSMPLSGGQS
jgi:hypothetical protein